MERVAWIASLIAVVGCGASAPRADHRRAVAQRVESVPSEPTDAPPAQAAVDPPAQVVDPPVQAAVDPPVQVVDPPVQPAVDPPAQAAPAPIAPTPRGQLVVLVADRPRRVRGMRFVFGGVIQTMTEEGCFARAILSVNGEDRTGPVPGSFEQNRRVVHLIGTDTDDDTSRRTLTIRIE